ncbi:MAG TPA: hypothetical protein VIN06_11390 [Devosia sp.]
MRTLVLYYSNTGNTQKVAKQLAARLGADLAEVTCGAYLRWYGPLAMAWDIFTRHAPKVDVLVPVGASYDVVVVGGPVWAAHAAPPILALANHPLMKSAFPAFFVTCSGDSPKSPPEPAVQEMRQMAKRPCLSSWIFRARDLDPGPLAAATERFAHTIEVVAADHLESRTARQPSL